MTTAGTKDPKSMKQEIFNQRLGGTGEEGQKRYEAMSPVEKERFDKKTGINKYAAPETGEGFAMSTGGAPVPGMETKTWNFHWAGVVTTSGPDRVTLDNYSVDDTSEKNADWNLQMFGPANKPGQTFYEQVKRLGNLGQDPTALRVEKGRLLSEEGDS